MRGFTLALIAAALLIILGGAWLYFKEVLSLKKVWNQPQFSFQSGVQQKNYQPGEAQKEDFRLQEDKNDFIFSSDELKISFRYPKRLGKIKFNFGEGETGRYFRGYADVALQFGGDSRDFSAGREASDFDIVGFKKEANFYYLLYPQDRNGGWLPSHCTSVVKEIQAGNTTGLILRSMEKEQTDGYYPCFAKYGAVFNLKSPAYPGIIFWTNEKDLSHSEFENIIKTLKIE